MCVCQVNFEPSVWIMGPEQEMCVCVCVFWDEGGCLSMERGRWREGDGEREREMERERGCKLTIWND